MFHIILVSVNLNCVEKSWTHKGQVIGGYVRAVWSPVNSLLWQVEKTFVWSFFKIGVSLVRQITSTKKLVVDDSELTVLYVANAYTMSPISRETVLFSTSNSFSKGNKFGLVHLGKPKMSLGFCFDSCSLHKYVYIDPRFFIRSYTFKSTMVEKTITGWF